MKNIKSKVLASCCQNYISSLNDNTNDNTIASCNDSKFSSIINITELYRTLTWVPCNMLLTKIKTDSNVIFMYLFTFNKCTKHNSFFYTLTFNTNKFETTNLD